MIGHFVFPRITAAQHLALRRSQVAVARFMTIGCGSPFYPAPAGARAQSGTASIGRLGSDSHDRLRATTVGYPSMREDAISIGRNRGKSGAGIR
jgi:hypothetical protein